MELELIESKFVEFVQEVIDNVHVVGLEPGKAIINNNQSVLFDLQDQNNGFYVEIKLNYNSKRRGEIRKNIINLTETIFRISNKRHYTLILVLGSKINDNDKLFFEKEIKSNSKITYFIYDLEILLTLAKKNNISTSEIFKKEIVAPSNPNLIDTKENSMLSSLQDFNGSFWWLNAANEYWDTNKFEIGNNFQYPKFSENGRRRSNFNNIKLGDLAISYQKDTHLIDGIYQVVKPSTEKSLTFRLIYKLPYRLSWHELINIDGFEKSAVFRANAQGSAYLLDIKLAIEIIIKAQVELTLLVDRINKIGIENLNGEGNNNQPPIIPPIIDELENEDENENNNSTDKIPFHLDNVETIDRLNREPVAKSLARLVNTEIFSNEDFQQSFMIHLQGEWGAGKSTFLNLLEKNLDTEKRKWIVVKFNAWQNQHINPPWWSFIDQIYLQSKIKFPFFKKRKLGFKENFRRIVWYAGRQKIATFLLSIIFIFILLCFGDSFFKALASYSTTKNVDNEAKGLAIDVVSKLIISLGSVIGLIFSLSKFISTPFLLRSSNEAKSFMERSADPMNKIKQHFNKLISNINEDFEVAVFIDDIDRCNKEYTVQLLEGIQTFFKDKRVLYLVAGDKDWITTCFENNYNEFANVINRKGEKLGELFLEKAFQLSLRIPIVSEASKEKYWHYILGVKNENKDIEISQLNQNKLIEINKRINDSLISGTLNNDFLNELETEFNISESEMSDIALESIDQSSKEIRHLLLEHHSLINSNPRSIKRLANNYTMCRNTLIAERKEIDRNKLFRWLIIEDTFPSIAKQISLSKIDLTNEEELRKYLDEFKCEVDDTFVQLFLDVSNSHGGLLENSEIKTIQGY